MFRDGTVADANLGSFARMGDASNTGSAFSETLSLIDPFFSAIESSVQGGERTKEGLSLRELAPDPLISLLCLALLLWCCWGNFTHMPTAMILTQVLKIRSV